MRYDLKKRGEVDRWAETSDGTVTASNLPHLVGWKIEAVLSWAAARGVRVYVTAPGGKPVRLENGG